MSLPPGPWSCEVRPDHFTLIHFREDPEEDRRHAGDSLRGFCYPGDAQFIIEASMVLAATGMSPREMAEKLGLIGELPSVGPWTYRMDGKYAVIYLYDYRVEGNEYRWEKLRGWCGEEVAKFIVESRAVCEATGLSLRELKESLK